MTPILSDLREVAMRDDPAALRRHYDEHATEIAKVFGVTRRKLLAAVAAHADSDLCSITCAQVTFAAKREQA